MRQLKILLADDTQSVGLFIARYLTDEGHSVTYVQCGEDAVAAYRDTQFDLVLMDVLMPGIGGLQAIKQIKALQTTTWVPVLIITGLDAEDDILSGFIAGADDYILKPIKPVTLDIRIRAMMRIASLQRSTAAIADNVIEGLIQIDQGGRILRFNPAAERIFGYPQAEVYGRNVNILMPSPDYEAHNEYIARYIHTGEARLIGMGKRVLGKRKNGDVFPMHLGVTEATTPDGRFFVGLVRDLTEEERMRAQVEFLATHDTLTGLPNRHECWKQLERRYAIKIQHSIPADFSIFYLDLDGFKAINDVHGHAAGDQVLREVSRRLKDVLFVRDFVARLGGDEFLAIVDGKLEDATTSELANRLGKALALPIESVSGNYTVGVSIGISHSRQHTDSVETLVAAADTAMYAAKRAGKGQCAIG